MRRRQFLRLTGAACAALSTPLNAAPSGSGRFKGAGGETISVSKAEIDALTRNIVGQVFRPGDAAYDSARTIWNARIDHRPKLIIRAQSQADVVHAVNFARESGVELSVRGGGHNHAGFAVSDGGVMLDMASMRKATVNADEKHIAIDAGSTFAEFDALTHEAGLAATGPIVSMVGLPGYTLGGGIGWLHRKFGAGCDNLQGAEIVLASGDIVRANERENEDLLWALRGGGGNFGIVTRLEYRLHELSHVLAGLIFYPLDQLDNIGAFVDDYLDDAPDNLNVWMLHRMAPPSPALPSEIHGTPVLILAVTWSGQEAEGERMIAPLRRYAEPLVDLVRWRPYPEWQGALDGAWGDGFCNEWVGGYLNSYDANTRAVIQSFVSDASSPISDFKLARLGGEFARTGPQDTAFGFRDARYAYVIQTRWPKSEDGTSHLKWTYDFHSKMQQHDTGNVYSNFIGKDEPANRVADAFEKPAHQRLRRIKASYDPENFFRQNHNIKPE
ncbi:MAG: FAD-binding oxidoreductase [Pseudomonadota bacterium]